MSEESIRFAASKEVQIGRVYVETEGLAQTAERYREIATDEFGWDPGPEHFQPARMIYVAETDELAREESEEHFRYFYEDLLGATFRSSAVRAAGDSEYREENAIAYEEEASARALEMMNFDFDDFVDSGKSSSVVRPP